MKQVMPLTMGGIGVDFVVFYLRGLFPGCGQRGNLVRFAVLKGTSEENVNSESGEFLPSLHDFK